MAVFEFPPDPVLDQTVVGSRGEVYVWDGEKWTWYPLGGGEGGGEPGGPEGALQFNSDGSFAGSGDLTWDSADNVLEVGGDINLIGDNPQFLINGQPLEFETHPAGSTGMIQYNSFGAFGADTNLFWDVADARLGVHLADLPEYTLDVGGDVNSTGCYHIGGVEFACGDDGGIELENITNINGVAVTDIAKPAGGDGQLQWNDDGVFGASAYLSWNDASQRLSVSSGELGSPGVNIIEPTYSRSGSVFVDQVGFQVIAGANTSLYLFSPDLLEASCGGGQVFTAGATTGAAFQFETVSGYGLVILPNNYVSIGKALPAYALDVAGDINITGASPVYRINGVPLSFGGQTPWTSDIDGGGYNLYDVDNISCNSLTVNGQPVGPSYWVGGAGGAIYYNGGNVGILTATPAQALDVNGSASASNWLLNNQNPNQAGSIGWVYGSLNGASLALYGANLGGGLAVTTNGAERFRILSNGFVGVNTGAPVTVLDVNGTIRSIAQTVPASGQGVEILFSDAWGFIVSYDRSAGTWRNLTLDSAALFLNPGGDYRPVGVGQTSPSTLFDVLVPSQEFGVSAAGGGGFRISTGYGAGTVSLIMGVHNWDYTWIQSVWPGSSVLHLALQPLGGNVGVNTASPLTALHVARDANIPGNGLPAFLVHGAYGGGVGILDGPGGNWQGTLWQTGGSFHIGVALYGQGVAEAFRVQSDYNVLVPNGGLAVGNQTASIPGAGDICIARNSNPATGAIFFGNSGSRYIHWDGATWNITGTMSLMGGDFYCNTGNFNGINCGGTVNIAGWLGVGGVAAITDPVTITGMGSGQLRLAYGSYGFFFRNDGTDLYMMRTNPGDPYGGWAGTFPIMINLGTGNVAINGSSPTGFALTAPSAYISSLSVDNSGLQVAGTLNTQNNWVGISGVWPTQALDVNGSIFCRSWTYVNNGMYVDTSNSNSGSPAIYFGPVGGTSEGIGSSRTNGSLNQYGLNFFTANSARMLILNDGRVGINIWPGGQILTVGGGIQLANGGCIMFNDGTVQCTAATGGTIEVWLLNQYIGTRPRITFVGGDGTAGYTSPNAADNPETNSVFVSFSTNSDIRLKRNIQPLSGGLEVINRIHPVECEFNGLAQTKSGSRFASVIAQELEPVLPLAVYKHPVLKKLDPSDSEETDILCIEPHAITFQCVLAIQELDQRVSAIEAELRERRN